MTSRDVEKRLGIPRKWLDNYAKKRGNGRGKAFDWESHFSEMQNLYKSENHKKYNKSAYLQLNLCEKTIYGKIKKTQIGIYPLDYADEIQRAMKSCLYLRYYFIDKMDYEIKTLESWAKNNEINDYDHVDICNFFLYELANKECLQSNLELVQVNRSPSSLRVKNKLKKEDIEQLSDYMEKNGYSIGLSYAKKILAIRKCFNIELPDEKIEVGKHIKNLENDSYSGASIDFESRYFSVNRLAESFSHLDKNNATVKSFKKFLISKKSGLEEELNKVLLETTDCDVRELRKNLSTEIDDINKEIFELNKALTKEYKKLPSYKSEIKREIAKLQEEVEKIREQIILKKTDIATRKAELHRKIKNNEARKMLPKRFISDDEIINKVSEQLKKARINLHEKINERDDTKDYLKQKPFEIIDLLEEVTSKVKQLSNRKKSIEQIDKIISLKSELKNINNILDKFADVLYIPESNNIAIENTMKTSQEILETLRNIPELKIQDTEDDILTMLNDTADNQFADVEDDKFAGVTEDDLDKMLGGAI